MACHAHLGEVHSLGDFLEQRGVQILVVSFTPPRLIEAFLAARSSKFPIVSDPRREAYRIFALGRTSALAFFKPRVLGKFVRQLWNGGRPRWPVDRDVLQLGGDFLFDSAGRLAWSWPSRDATDRPATADIRAAVEALDDFPSRAR
jgi:hypothetical protein